MGFDLQLRWVKSTCKTGNRRSTFWRTRAIRPACFCLRAPSAGMESQMYQSNPQALEADNSYAKAVQKRLEAACALLSYLPSKARLMEAAALNDKPVACGFSFVCYWWLNGTKSRTAGYMVAT